MALTYDDSASLMKDPSFIGRIKVACLKYADYIINEAPDTPAHSARIRWAQTCNMNPDLTAQNLGPTTVMDDKVQADGATISDGDLQSAVETAINKVL